jgi:hypothetical protein
MPKFGGHYYYDKKKRKSDLLARQNGIVKDVLQPKMRITL